MDESPSKSEEESAPNAQAEEKREEKSDQMVPNVEASVDSKPKETESTDAEVSSNPEAKEDKPATEEVAPSSEEASVEAKQESGILNKYMLALSFKDFLKFLLSPALTIFFCLFS